MDIDSDHPMWFFNGHGILKEQLESMIRRFREAIYQIPADEYLVMNLDDLKVRYNESLKLNNFPILLPDTKHVITKSDHKELMESREYGRTREREVRFLSIRMGISFTGDNFYFRPRPQQALTITQMDRDCCPKGFLLNNELHFDYDFPETDTTFLETHFEHDIELVNRYLSWCKTEVDKHNADLSSIITSTIDTRLAELQKDDQFLKDLKYPLKKQPEIPAVFQMPAKQIVVKFAPSKGGKPAENSPVLSNPDYEMILEILQTMSVAMERSPKVFCELEEEEIRDFFLVILNSHFKGLATGETFNKNGKTDILIRSGDQNVFIAECKVWGGEKLLHETIDQLLGYVTWRDTKTAVLIFNRNVNFTGVLDTIKKSIVTHPCYIAKSNMTNQSLKIETILPYSFRQKNDPTRLLSLTVLGFDIPGSN
ncbi:MAG: hypothetical protein PHW12_00340 [Smithella sp.]|nr:hypothetical protein [Smithella sp.]